MIYFAQLQTADPVHVRDFLIIGGFLLSAVAGFGSFVSSRRTQKREVTLTDELVTKTACSMLHSQTVRDMERIEMQINGIRVEMKADRQGFEDRLLKEVGAVHTRVNEVLDGVAELRGKMNPVRK